MVIVKVLSFVIILCVIKFMADKIQCSKDNITEPGEILIDRKNFSKVYFVLAIAFTIIFTIALSLPNDLDKSTYQMVTGISIGVVLFFMIMSILCNRSYLKIGVDGLTWQKMIGGKGTIKYKDITSYDMKMNGDLKLYQGKRCILRFSTYIDRTLVLQRLKNAGISSQISLKNLRDSSFSMKMGKGYVIFDGMCIFIFVLFFMGSTYYRMFLGMIFSFGMGIVSILSFLIRKSRTIMIENKTIIATQLLKKQQKIPYGKVEHLSIESGNNTHIIVVHSKDGTRIKIPTYFENTELFEDVISKQHWKYK